MPKNLLLADDSITIQKVVGITFASEDFNIVAVDNGQDALTRLADVRPDIVLADVVMPRKNGYELCEAIKADPALKHIPVLLLAGTFEAFDEARARAVGADAHIAKPFDSQSLINKVNELIACAAPVGKSAPEMTPATISASEPARTPSKEATAHSSAQPAIAAPPGVRIASPAAPAFPRPEQPVIRPPAMPPPIVSRAAISPPAPSSSRTSAPSGGPIASARAKSVSMSPTWSPATVTGTATGPMPSGPARGVAPESSRDRRAQSSDSSVSPVRDAATTRPRVELDWSDLGFSDPSPIARQAASPATPASTVRPTAPWPSIPEVRSKASGGVPGSTPRPQFGLSPALSPAPDAPSPLTPSSPAPVGSHAASHAAPAPDDSAFEFITDDAEPLPPGEPIDLAELQSDPTGAESLLVASRPPPTGSVAAGIVDPPDRRFPGAGGFVPGDGFSVSAGRANRADESNRPSGDGGEAQLRDALSRASREVIERIAWEIMPTLAETIIREHIERLVKERQQ